jgi:hypothetical protein
MGAYYDFADISAKIPFPALLNSLNIPYSDTNEGLKGSAGKFHFVVNTQKNLFLSPHDKEAKGGVINFYSILKGIGLREAAEELKKMFLDKPAEQKRPTPDLELHYCDTLKKFGFTEEFCKNYEIGLVKQKSIMAKKIALMIRHENGDKEGYIGYDAKEDKWFFPKGSKRNWLYNLHRQDKQYAILTACPLDCLRLINIGYPYTVALGAEAATDHQIELISARFKRLLILHKDPQNIVHRLFGKVFVKAPKLDKAIADMDKETIKNLF